MKKFVIMVMAIMAAIMLCSCNSKTETTAIDDTIHEFVEEIEEETVKVENILVENDSLEQELCEKGYHEYCAIDYYIVEGKVVEYHTHSLSTTVFYDGELIK